MSGNTGPRSRAIPFRRGQLWRPKEAGFERRIMDVVVRLDLGTNRRLHMVVFKTAFSDELMTVRVTSFRKWVIRQKAKLDVRTDRRYMKCLSEEKKRVGRS